MNELDAQEASDPESVNWCTNGLSGTVKKRNVECVFPFVWKGTTYNSCVKDDNSFHFGWCATRNVRKLFPPKFNKWGSCERCENVDDYYFFDEEEEYESESPESVDGVVTKKETVEKNPDGTVVKTTIIDMGEKDKAGTEIKKEIVEYTDTVDGRTEEIKIETGDRPNEEIITTKVDTGEIDENGDEVYDTTIVKQGIDENGDEFKITLDKNGGRSVGGSAAGTIFKLLLGILFAMGLAYGGKHAYEKFSSDVAYARISGAEAEMGSLKMAITPDVVRMG